MLHSTLPKTILLLIFYGSGPSLTGLNKLERWHEETGNPFDIFGSGIERRNAREKRALLNQTQFCFFRETISLQRARDADVACPVKEFGLDATTVYIRSSNVFGFEPPSPILCIGHGIPGIVDRFTEQGIKGNIWWDIRLDDWLFDIDLDA